MKNMVKKVLLSACLLVSVVAPARAGVADWATRKTGAYVCGAVAGLAAVMGCVFKASKNDGCANCANNVCTVDHEKIEKMEKRATIFCFAGTLLFGGLAVYLHRTK